MVFDGETGLIDPTVPIQIVALGKKGYGKSVLARMLFDSWPGDKLLIDVNGTVTPDVTWVEMRGDAPTSWPDEKRDGDEPLTLHVIPDMAREDCIDVIDRYIEIAYLRGDILIWVDEAGIVARANALPPHVRQVLHQGRHRRISSIWCAPRAMAMDTLVIAQADLLFVFTMPAPSDKLRVADTIGWDPREFAEAVQRLAQFEYLRFDATAPPPTGDGPDLRLVHFPPLPPDVVVPPREVHAGTGSTLDKLLDTI